MGDHYKWRAMRLCGVEEKYITGDVDYKEKFLKYAEILPIPDTQPSPRGEGASKGRIRIKRSAVLCKSIYESSIIKQMI